MQLVFASYNGRWTGRDEQPTLARANDNEEKSAEYAATALNQLKLAISTVQRVKNLILSTRTHQTHPTDIDCQILLDADLAILIKLLALYLLAG
jgi:predicted metal-dependent HD superfamily phosphohydrolase